MTIPLYQLNLSWKVEVILPYLYKGNIFFEFENFRKIFEKFLKIFKTTKKMKNFEKLNFFENFKKIEKKKIWSWVQALFLLEYRNAIPQRITRGVWKFPIHDHRKSEPNSSLRVTCESKK